MTAIPRPITAGHPVYPGAFRRFFRDPGAILRYRGLPLSNALEKHLDRLMSKGYTRSSLYRILRNVYLFQRFLYRKRLNPERITSPIVQGFVTAQYGPSSRTHRLRKIRGLLYYDTVRFLAEALETPALLTEPTTSVDCRSLPRPLRIAFQDFCLAHRGLVATTIKSYGRTLERLGRFLDKKGVLSIRAVALADVDDFLKRLSPDYSSRSLIEFVATLRLFFRFLYLEGHLPKDLSPVIGYPSRFHKDWRPKYIPWPKVQKFLARMDRTHATGKRDYAIVLLMTSYGLRAREIARLKVSDIQWDQGRLFIRERKGGCYGMLPLLPPVMEAFKDYLAVRPPAPFPELFLSAHAPIQPLGRRVSAITCEHLEKYLGRLLPRQGAHTLRHSFAKAMLDRGASLPQIGAILGHKCLNSTLIYTRIATEDLREMADNYAQLLNP